MVNIRGSAKPRTEWGFIAGKIIELNIGSSSKTCLIIGGKPNAQVLSFTYAIAAMLQVLAVHQDVSGPPASRELAAYLPEILELHPGDPWEP